MKTSGSTAETDVDNKRGTVKGNNHFGRWIRCVVAVYVFATGCENAKDVFLSAPNNTDSISDDLPRDTQVPPESEVGASDEMPRDTLSDATDSDAPSEPEGDDTATMDTENSLSTDSEHRDTDSVSDVDTDTDTDSDTDVDTDSDVDTDTDTDIDTDTDADGDSDTDTDADTDTAGECQKVLRAVIRDFSYEHPDFADSGFCCNLVKGLVQEELGPDEKPVFASAFSATDTGIQALTSEETFSQWYRTVDGVNHEFRVDLPLVAVQEGVWQYSNDMFFPLLNDQGFGNQYMDYNYNFTTEIHVKFVYEKGQVFSFKGDDDLWIFINGHLAMDLGGIHFETSDVIDMDALAAEIGLVPKETYSMDIFHAERQPADSHFKVETNISCMIPVIVV